MLEQHLMQPPVVAQNIVLKFRSTVPSVVHKCPMLPVNTAASGAPKANAPPPRPVKPKTLF